MDAVCSALLQQVAPPAHHQNGVDSAGEALDANCFDTGDDRKDGQSGYTGRSPDARLKGLVLRVMPSGVKSFYCEFARGKRVWLGRADAVGLAEARDSARAILSEVYRGIDPIEAHKPKQGMPTFRAFLDNDYAVWAKANQKAHAQNLKRLATAFKALLDKITGLDVGRWRAGEIERGPSLQAINRDISSIKAAFNRAVDWELIGTNPLAKVKNSRTGDCLKVRFLSDAEEGRLRAAIDAREERRRAERDSC